MLVLRPPVVTDGMAIHRLIAICPPLDVNSEYCYLLLSLHFSETSVVAAENGELVGFISGYQVPSCRDTLFIWQVAVSPEARGQGLGGRMIGHILDRQFCAGVSYIETTVTKANEPSWKIFEGVAASFGTRLQRSTLFHRDTHFEGHHESEILARIGPLNPIRGASPLVSSADAESNKSMET